MKYPGNGVKSPGNGDVSRELMGLGHMNFTALPCYARVVVKTTGNVVKPRDMGWNPGERCELPGKSRAYFASPIYNPEVRIR